MIEAYTGENIIPVWGDVEPLIQIALDRGSIHTTESLYSDALDSRIQVWVYRNNGVKGVVTTGISDKRCYLVTGAGRMREWLRFFPYIEDFAITEGCEYLYIQGRKGWSKLLSFTIVGTDELGLHIMRKKLCQTHLATKTKPTETAQALTR